MKKNKIIAIIIVAVLAIIGCFAGHNYSKTGEIIPGVIVDEPQCLYGCPSRKKKRKTEATRFKRQYIKITPRKEC